MTEAAKNHPITDHAEPLFAAIAAAADQDHHISWNRNTLWLAFSVIRDGYRQERIRQSLQTSDWAVARKRRDEILRQWARGTDPKLSLRLRYPNPRKHVA